MKIDLDLIKWFIKERESIRNGALTNDYVLKNSKFCNIHREHDKVSQWIFKNCPTIEYIFIARLINRIDLLEYWKECEFDTDLFIRTTKVFTNSGAYQFYPRKGETIRDIFEDINEAALELSAIVTFDNLDYSIKELSIKLSEVVNRPLHFYFMMVILDAAQMGLIKKDILKTEPYMGPGGKPILKELNMSLKEVSVQLQLPMYDVEHILCEVRKYVNRSINGIPNNRKREN